MKKSFYLMSFIFCLSFFNCNTYEGDLEKMGNSVRSHFRYKDAENGTKTTIQYLKAVSYEKIPEEQRQNPDEVYECNVYVKGNWIYDNSYRIFNLDDTFKCYFNQKKAFVRMQEKEN